MAKHLKKTDEKGFSLIELLVALVFTLFLMMGLASVFRASLTSFYTSGENISSARRNRLSIDLLGEDINMAGMYLTDMALPPFTVPTLPPFFILPNMEIKDKGDDDPNLGTTDKLYFYMDEPLPFEGTLRGSSTQQTAADMVLSGAALDKSDNNFTVNCMSSEYAQQVVKRVSDGQRLVAIFKDFWEAVEVGSPKYSGQNVTFATGSYTSAGITGSGGGNLLPSRVNHLDGAGVVFVKPAQMILYKIEMLKLDPNKNDLVPCLVRYQNEYSYDGHFDEDNTSSRQIITENVSGFKVYLSVNGGVDWAGLNFKGTDFPGWNADTGMRGQIDSQLGKIAGAYGIKSTRGNEHWFRSVPTLVRIDITTRTATKRAESYNDPNEQPVYKQLTQTLIFVPRHFGLPMG